MTSPQVKIAIEQIASSGDAADNLERVKAAVRRGAAAGARVIVLPEATMVRFGISAKSQAEPIDGPWATAIRDLARELDVYAVVGMFQPGDDGRVRNTLLVTGPDVHDGYDKIHLFDAFGFSESKSVQPGSQPFTFTVDGMVIGVATCYDVRFPGLFHELTDRGAQAIIVSAHWGAGPGKLDAWQLVNRARGVDSTSYIIACDQADAATAGVQEGPGAKFGIGHSMIVSPLGEVLDELGAEEGSLLATLDSAEVERVRTLLPVLANRVGAFTGA